jgi:gamma-glutamyltranspeptidase/glutathione hydrolase
MTDLEQTRSAPDAVQLARGRDGVVATGHALATAAAMDALRGGGNAVDAAVSAALVLAVVCPYACTLAGDVYLLIFDPKRQDVFGLNGTGRAPRAATLGRFAAGIPRDGAQSATVPGFLAGLADALDRHGTRDLASLMQPAVAHAADGFPVHAYFARNVRDRASLLARDPEASALFLPNGAPLATGTCFKQPQLADSLRIITEQGVDAFYRGEVADRMLAGGERVGWLISRDDLATHASLEQAPISAPFYGRDVWTMPPNSYGPTLLLQLLELEAGDIATVDPDSVEFVARGYAARRAAYKAAGKLIGDPDRLEAPLRRLLVRVCADGGRVSDLSGLATAMPAESRDRCTTNVVVIDHDGLAVSLIQSISAPFGAGTMLPGTGILLNNRMGGFVNDPASDNCVGPGKRPAHTLAPCIVTEAGRLSMTLGTPGTVGQTCTLAQFLARTLACGQDIAVAAERPRWSVDFQGKPVAEDGMAEDLQSAIRARLPETKVMPTGWISFGSIKLVKIDDGDCVGLADHRRSATTGAL